MNDIVTFPDCINSFLRITCPGRQYCCIGFLVRARDGLFFLHDKWELFFFLSRFSFGDTTIHRTAWGCRKPSLFLSNPTTCSQTFRHQFSFMQLKYLPRVFNCGALITRLFCLSMRLMNHWGLVCDWTHER